MKVNELIEQMINLSDEDILHLRDYCDKELNHRLYWLKKGLKEIQKK